MKEKSIKVNTLLNTFRMLLTILMPLITFPYTSRIFMTEGNGYLSFASSVTQIFTLFASLGIYTYGVREGAKIRNNKSKFSKLTQELLIINGLSTLIAYIVFFLMIYFVKSFFQYRTVLLIYGLTIGFTALGLDWVYGAYEEYKYITIRQIICQIFTIITLFFFVHKYEDIYKWAFISVASNVGANIFNFIHARIYIDKREFIRKKLDIIKHLKPVMVLFATQLASKVYSNLDIVLLGILTSDKNIGLYSAAVKINVIMVTIFSAMTPVFVPKIIKCIYYKKCEEYEVFINNIFRLIIMLSLPIIAGLEINRNEILVLLAGPKFSDAGFTMAILLPVILICSLTNVFYYNILVPYNKEKIMLIFTVISSCVNLILSYILIKNYNEVGAAIGSLTSEFIGLMLAGIYCTKNKYINKKCFPPIKIYLIGTAGVMICCLLVRYYLQTNMVLNLVYSIILSVFVYFSVLYLLKEHFVKKYLDLILKQLLHIYKK